MISRALRPAFHLRYGPSIAAETPPAGFEQVFMDLGDFVPEERTIAFRICGREYQVRYMEARVDEVLAILQESMTERPIAELADARRRYCAELFSRNLAIGNPEQLKADLALVPYSSLRGGLDIYGMFMETQARVKKKHLGELEENLPTPQSGFLARLRSWLKPAKAV